MYCLGHVRRDRSRGFAGRSQLGSRRHVINLVPAQLSFVRDARASRRVVVDARVGWYSSPVSSWHLVGA